MENVKPKEVFVDQWTADLFSNFTGVSDKGQPFRSTGESLYRTSLIKRALEFIDVIEEHFEGTSLNNTAEEIADNYIATAKEAATADRFYG